jgi:biopolymer transport protein ExbD
MLPHRRQFRNGHADNTTTAAAIIDVVFLLLIYFAVAYETPDLLAALPVSLPDDSPGAPNGTPIHVAVHRDGYAMDRTPVSALELRSNLGRLARASTNQAVLIRVDHDATHDRLIMVMDLCHGAKLTRIAIVTRSEDST